MQDDAFSIDYEATPTGALFHSDDNFGRFILGPFGSGKTSAGLMELLIRGLKQQPDKYGKRRTAGLVVRNSYPELRSTTIPSYLYWFGGITRITYGSPITSFIELPLPDGTVMEQKTYFLGLDNEDDAKKLMSLNITFAMIDEFVFITKPIMDAISGRTGRYPETNLKLGYGPTWHGFWGTSNPCPDTHWYFNLAEVEKPKLYSFYRQPPGLFYDDHHELKPNPNAENLNHLPAGYYEKQAIGKDSDYIKVYLMGQYGELRSGKVVYPEYNDDIHCSKTELGPHPNLEIIVGLDFGIHGNAAVFAQLTPMGELIVFDEILKEDMSITAFVKDILKPHIANHYFKYNISFICDPAATIRSQSNKKSALDILKENEFTAYETAYTNEFVARREGVVYFLKKQGGFSISPKCVYTRRGFLSKYKYEKISGSKTEKIKEMPEKNIFSHNHDALQYICLKFKRLKTRRRSTGRANTKYNRPASSMGY